MQRSKNLLLHAS